MTYIEEAKSLATYYNTKAGNLNLIDGLNCNKCLNRGYTSYFDKGEIKKQECSCMARRRVILAVKNSGAEYLLKIHNFDNYQHGEKWQDYIFRKAESFAEVNSGLWYIGGQIGSGKTMICIAILNRMLERGKQCRYYIWQNLVNDLNKLQVDNYPEYEAKLLELATIPVLYLDDFIREEPSKAEIKTAYRIINARYMATLGGESLITIISSQRLISQIMSVDEAVGSRIYEIGLDNIIGIEKNEARNWRMKLIREKIKTI